MSLDRFFTVIALRFQLIDAPVQRFEEKGIVNLGGFALGRDGIGKVLVVGVQGDNLARAQWFATGKLPLNGEDHTVEMTFFDDAALTNVIMIDPRWKPFGQGSSYWSENQARFQARNFGQ